MPTAIVLAGNKFFPGFGDWYLGKTGYESQMTDELEDPQRPNNLWEPLPGDFGAHGEFDERGPYEVSPQFWATRHRKWLAAGLAATAMAGALLYSRGGRIQ